MGQRLRAIPCKYKDVWYPSRTEAMNPVFFDEMGIKWRHEPVTFTLHGGVKYTPDFLLENVWRRGEDGDKLGDLWVEVKGVHSYPEIDSHSRAKIEMFAENHDIIVAGALFAPNKRNMTVTDIVNRGFDTPLYNYKYIDGDEYPCFFSKHNGEIWLCGPDHDEWDYGKSAEIPLSIAQMYQFEKGEPYWYGQ